MKTATTISMGDMTTEATFTGIGIFLALAILALAIWLEYYKDNKLQDWLERCWFGNLEGYIYPDGPTEQAEFNLAAEAMR